MHLARILGPLVGFLALWLTLATPAWGQGAGNRDEATAFLEGGSEAFLLRKERYGH